MENSQNIDAHNLIEKQIIELLRELLHVLIKESIPSWIDLQLSLPQLRILFIIAHNSSASINQIADQLRVGEPTASHLVDKLYKAGFIQRSEDPRDRRRAIVQLSPNGKLLTEKLLGWEGFFANRLQEIPKEELLPFQHGLTSILARTHEQESNDSDLMEAKH
jgi:MarR family transcriptional regulator, organic hydroperoxide resistance regulator